MFSLYASKWGDRNKFDGDVIGLTFIELLSSIANLHILFIINYVYIFSATQLL